MVRTSIFKSPVAGRVPIRNNNLTGDAQSDLSVHGGRAKAVYAYPHEHYAFWRGQLPGVDLQPGHFGENLTIEGLLEEDVHLGDRLQIGSAELVVTQPTGRHACPEGVPRPVRRGGLSSGSDCQNEPRELLRTEGS